MLKKPWWALAGVALVLAPPPAARAAFFTNGSFEQGPHSGGWYDTLYAGSTAITGWTVGGHSVDWIGTYWQAADGNRSIDLNGLGPGWISQTFDTVSGQEYTVSFAMAGNPDGLNDVKVQLAFAGADWGMFWFNAADNTHANMGWETKSFSFVALDSQTTLTFASATPGFYGPALDNVSVTPADSIHPTPEPASAVAMGVGGLGLLAGLWRRNRKAALS
jgi:choice-of-anchor C domain-containing protein